MRVLVMGGSFFIGYHLVQELLRRDHEVTVCNIDSRTYPGPVREIYCDRKDHEALRSALAGLEFDTVFDNTAFDRDDVEPLIEILLGRVKQYVFTSSSTTYARSAVQPLSEDFPLQAVDGQNVAGAYGAGKARCEAVLREAHESGGFPITIVRPTHCLGPDNYNLGWEPSFFARIERGRPILVPGDGTPLVPFVHVDDLARGFATLLGEDRAIGEAFNVVGSEAITLGGLIRSMGKAVGI